MVKDQRVELVRGHYKGFWGYVLGPVPGINNKQFEVQLYNDVIVIAYSSDLVLCKEYMPMPGDLILSKDRDDSDDLDEYTFKVLSVQRNLIAVSGEESEDALDEFNSSYSMSEFKKSFLFKPLNLKKAKKKKITTITFEFDSKEYNWPYEEYRKIAKLIETTDENMDEEF